MLQKVHSKQRFADCLCIINAYLSFAHPEVKRTPSLSSRRGLEQLLEEQLKTSICPLRAQAAAESKTK